MYIFIFHRLSIFKKLNLLPIIYHFLIYRITNIKPSKQIFLTSKTHTFEQTRTEINLNIYLSADIVVQRRSNDTCLFVDSVLQQIQRQLRSPKAYEVVDTACGYRHRRRAALGDVNDIAPSFQHYFQSPTPPTVDVHVPVVRARHHVAVQIEPRLFESHAVDVASVALLVELRLRSVDVKCVFIVGVRRRGCFGRRVDFVRVFVVFQLIFEYRSVLRA